VLDAPLPQAIGAPIYGRLGDLPAYVMMAIAFFVVVRRRLAGNTAKV
jgi:apolipoprotein N-acyltransferase